MRPRAAWLLAHTPHFEIASGLSARRTRELAQELERFRGAALAWGELEDRASSPTLVVLFPRTRHFATLRPRRELSGLFVSALNESFLLVDASERDEALRIARHELVHRLQPQDPARALPAWYREGLADLLSTASIESAAFEVGRAPADHQALARAAALPLGSVLEEADALRWDARSLPAFYAQSWAVAHYFWLGEEAPRGGLPQFLALLASGRGAAEACEQALGRPLGQLEADVLRHVEQLDLPRARFPLGVASAAPVSLRPLDSAERDALLGELALALGEPRWRRAERWLRSALAHDPARLDARASLAWLLAARGRPDASAELALAESTAAVPDRDSEWRLGDAWYALAARSAPGGDAPARLARARAHYERSLELEPAHLGARLGLARVALALGQTERAASDLEAAERDPPGTPIAALELAALWVESGRPELARPALRRLLAGPLHAEARAGHDARLERLLGAAGLEPTGPPSLRHLAARLDVREPGPGTALATDLAWFEVKGKAGLWEAPLQDIAIALDVSNSTLDASGVDVDQDGRTGRTRRAIGLRATNPLTASSDRGDSIVRAELAAAERLLAELDPDTTRVALVLFTARAQLAAPLGTPHATLEKLARYRVRYDKTGTSFEAALRTAFEELLARRRPDSRSQRTILVLSDGEPTVPSRAEARSRALALADELARFGIRVHGFALGEQAAEKSETLREIAERTGGRFAAIADLADVSFLQRAQLTGLDAVSLRNARSGEPARAVRVFADGSFDGFVPLVPGPNELEIRASVAGRAPLVARRTVVFVPPEAGGGSSARSVELLQLLRERSEEIALRAELTAERARGEQRSLAIDVAAPPGEGHAE